MPRERAVLASFLPRCRRGCPWQDQVFLRKRKQNLEHLGRVRDNLDSKSASMLHKRKKWEESRPVDTSWAAVGGLRDKRRLAPRPRPHRRPHPHPHRQAIET